MSISYRHATRGDAALLGRLAAELVRMHHAIDKGRFMAPPPDLERGYGGWLAHEAERDGAVVWIALEGETAVGYAYATLEDRDWNELLEAHGKLHDILVDPAARRRGIARELLVRLRDELVARGCERIVLSTATQNEAAQRLFASLGFRPTMIEMTWSDRGRTG